MGYFIDKIKEWYKYQEEKTSRGVCLGNTLQDLRAKYRAPLLTIDTDNEEDKFAIIDLLMNGGYHLEIDKKYCMCSRTKEKCEMTYNKKETSWVETGDKFKYAAKPAAVPEMKIDYAKETGSSAVAIAEFQTSEGLSTKEFFERNSKTLDTNAMYDPDEAERWRKALIEGKFPDDYEPVIKDEDKIKEDPSYCVEYFKKICESFGTSNFYAILGLIATINDTEVKKELIDVVKKDPEIIAKGFKIVMTENDELQAKNTELKHQVEYYENYVKWLEENYIFILRSPKSLKEDFDKLIGGKENE